eukprot:29218-Pelagococcus_subviridis.AAC.3
MYTAPSSRLLYARTFPSPDSAGSNPCSIAPGNPPSTPAGAHSCAYGFTRPFASPTTILLPSSETTTLAPNPSSAAAPKRTFPCGVHPPFENAYARTAPARLPAGRAVASALGAPTTSVVAALDNDTTRPCASFGFAPATSSPSFVHAPEPGLKRYTLAELYPRA